MNITHIWDEILCTVWSRIKFYLYCIESHSSQQNLFNSTSFFLLIYDSLSFKSKLLSVHKLISGFHPVAIVYIYYNILICLDVTGKVPSLCYYRPLYFHINVKIHMFPSSLKKSLIELLMRNELCLCINIRKSNLYNIKVSSA